MDLKDARFYAIDIETTGLDPKKDAIISFACVPIMQLKVLVRDTYYTLIRPSGYNLAAMKFHGLSEDNLKDAPSFEETAERILEVTDGILVGHSVEFDFTFLKNHFRPLGIRYKRDLVDIALLERWLRRKHKTDDGDLSLDDLIAAYGLEQHYRHNAAADAFYAAQIFQIQLRAMAAFGIDSAEKIIRAAKSCRHCSSGIAF